MERKLLSCFSAGRERMDDQASHSEPFPMVSHIDLVDGLRAFGRPLSEPHTQEGAWLSWAHFLLASLPLPFSSILYLINK